MIMKKYHKFTYGGQNLSKITAFSQEILVTDVCVRRKSTIKSHPDPTICISKIVLNHYASQLEDKLLYPALS